MGEVKGRCWPHDLPFSGSIVDANTKQPYVRNGFVCDSRPGDFAFKDYCAKGTNEHDKVDTLEFTCPRTGKYCGHIRVGYPNKPAQSPSWKWDGDWQEPTLEPSINCISGCGWHGWLKKGVFTDV